MKRNKIFIINTILIILFCFLAIILINISDMPIIWLGFSAALITIYKTIKSQKTIKAIWLNISVFILCVTFFETFLHIKEFIQPLPNKSSFIYGDQYFVSHEALGYAPKKNMQTQSKRYENKKLAYNVTYTIDKKGLRISPLTEKNTFNKCVLFFGGSFTYGEGVEDHETMPYLVQDLSGNQYRSYNFGFHGFGPHQMLSYFHHHMVEEIVSCNEKVYLIYQFIMSHVRRAAGREPWGEHGPKFILRKDGMVNYAGHFDDNYFLLTLKRLSYKYLTYRNIKQYNKKGQLLEDIQLLVGILKTTRHHFKSLYPNGEFHIIFWNVRGNPLNDKRVLEGLKKEHFKIHLITSILVDFNKDMKQYLMSQYDDHPNQMAYQTMARYVVDKILSKDK